MEENYSVCLFCLYSFRQHEKKDPLPPERLAALTEFFNGLLMESNDGDDDSTQSCWERDMIKRFLKSNGDVSLCNQCSVLADMALEIGEIAKAMGIMLGQNEKRATGVAMSLKETNSIPEESFKDPTKGDDMTGALNEERRIDQKLMAEAVKETGNKEEESESKTLGDSLDPPISASTKKSSKKATVKQRKPVVQVLLGWKYRCQECKRNFCTRSGLNKHKRSLHSELLPYTCNFCGKKFRSLVKHLPTHSEKEQKDVTATSGLDAGKDMVSKGLWSQENISVKNEPGESTKDSVTSSSKMSMTTRKRAFSQAFPESPASGPEKSLGAMRSKTKSKNEDGKLNLPSSKGDTRARTKQNFSKRKKPQRSSSSMTCAQPKHQDSPQFSSKTVKNGVKLLSYKCIACRKTYSSKSNLKKHESMVHRSLMLYKCRFCDKKFNTMSSCSRHQNVHSGLKPHECIICDSKFTTRSNLCRHVKIHYEAPGFDCEKCDKTFIRKLDLRNHQETFHA